MGPASGGIVSRKTRSNYAWRALLLWYGYVPGRDDAFDRHMEKTLVNGLRQSETTDKAVALALDGVYGPDGRLDTSRTHMFVPNDFVLRAVRRNPELLFGPSVNPARADAIDELHRVKEQGAVLVKWVPNSQGFDPSDSKFIPFYRKLAELRLPLLSHTGYEHCVPATDQMCGDPARLRPALEEGVTVIAGHSGCSGHFRPVEFLHNYVEMLKIYPNLHGDLSALLSLSRFGYARRLPELIPDFPDRHLQATDFPVTPLTLLLAPRLGPRKTAELTLIRNLFDRDVKTKLALGYPEKILYNAARILGID